MNDLYLTSNELDECLDQYLLTLPTVFDECMSPEQQILWLLIHKQNLLVEGDNITLTPNEDGTVTISSEASGATYRIETATPDEGYTAAYILKNVDTEEQAGVKIQVPTVAGPQGPQGETGPQGPAGQDGSDGTDGVGITSIIFKETDPSGNNVYTVTLTNGNTYDITCPIGPTGATGSQGATGPAGPGVPAGGTVGQVLKKSGSGDYETNWEDPSGGLPSGGSQYQYLMKDASGESWNWTRVIGLAKYRAGNSNWGSPSDSTHRFNSVTVNNSGYPSDSIPVAHVYAYRSANSSSLSAEGGSVRVSLDLTVVVGTGNWQTRLNTDGNFGSALRLPSSGTFSSGGSILGFSDEAPTLRLPYDCSSPATAVFTDTTTGQQYIKRAKVSMSTNYLGNFYFYIGICNRTALPAGTYYLSITSGL